MELLDQTAEDDWRKIANDTSLKFAWIRAVAKGQITECGSAKLEQLYLALTDAPCVIVRP